MFVWNAVKNDPSNSIARLIRLSVVEEWRHIPSIWSLAKYCVPCYPAGSARSQSQVSALNKTTRAFVTSPPVSEAHAQSLGLLPLLAFQVLQLLFLKLSVDLELFVGQTHGSHAALAKRRVRFTAQFWNCSTFVFKSPTPSHQRFVERLTWSPPPVFLPRMPAPLVSSQPLGLVSPPPKNSCCSPSERRGPSLPPAASWEHSKHRWGS